MATEKRLVLDILKPHDRNTLDFGKRLAEEGALRFSHSHAIVRRYLVVNGFDGALTMLGVIAAIHIGGDVDLGVFLGHVGGTSWLAGGIKTVLIALVTVALILLLGS